MSVEAKIQRNSEILFEEYGQRRSMVEMLAVDKLGHPIPWYTYPFIEYLSSLHTDEAHVFEFGCGYSSLYWGARAQTVTCVDHDPEWIHKISPDMPTNVTPLLRETEDAYVCAILEQDKKYDIIIIDGRWRVQCVEKALHSVAKGGMIIFDNADWYPKGCEILRNEGFFQCDFSGFGPINNYTWTTSIFIKAHTNLQKKYLSPSPKGSWKQVSDFTD